MAESTMSNPQIDLLALLNRQNHYQRLGLKTNAVSVSQIEAAYTQRIALLQECSGEITGDVSVVAAKMIDEAYGVLRDERRKREYDAYLENRNRFRGAPAPGQRSPGNPDGNSAGAPQKTTSILGRYEVGTVLYEGQRTTICDATDTRVNRPVVIKRVRHELSQTADYLRMFREEAEQFARFTSGHLVKVLDYDPATGSLVMEKLQCDLRPMIKSKGCDWQIAFGILSDCLVGLSELHSSGMTHSRIDLSHIMLDPHGGAKLTVTPGMRQGSQAILPGAQSRYLAPELLNPAVFGEPGPNSDLYSLGFVILELIVGSSFAERVSKAIENDDKNPTSWLKWHASPTDHLPAIETLVPSLPAPFAEVLRQMTCKQHHERYQTASECLQALRDLQASINVHNDDQTWAIPKQPTDEGVELLGTPAPLHSRYELPPSLNWGTILRDPSALFRPEAARHRIFVLGGVCLAILFMIVLASQASPDAGVAQTEENKQEEPDYGSLSSLAEYPDLTAPDKLDSNGMADSDTDSSTDTTNVTPPVLDINASHYCEVTFEVQPHGRVMMVEPLDVAEEFFAPTKDSEGTWSLATGRYSVRYTSGTTGTEVDTQIIVPEDRKTMTFVLQLSEVEKMAQAEPQFTEPQPRKLPSMHARSSHPFPVSAAGSLSANQLARSLDVFLRQFALIKTTTIPDLTKRASGRGDRDPRITFAYALQASRDGDRNLAVEQCIRALDEAERAKVPFILPLELLCHLELQDGGMGLSIALTACLDTTQWIQDLQRNGRDPRIERTLEDLAWWTGLVVGYIENTRTPEARSKVDLVEPKNLFRNEFGGVYADLFDGAIESIQSKHKEIMKGHLANIDYQRDHRIHTRQRMHLNKEHRKLSEKEEQTRETAQRVARTNPSIMEGGPNQQQNSDPFAGMKLLRESGSEVREQMEIAPQRPYGGPVSPATFTNYVPRDLSVLAQLTRETIPEIQSANVAMR